MLARTSHAALVRSGVREHHYPLVCENCRRLRFTVLVETTDLFIPFAFSNG